jgi:hypothetical protein
MQARRLRYLAGRSRKKFLLKKQNNAIKIFWRILSGEQPF